MKTGLSVLRRSLLEKEINNDKVKKTKKTAGQAIWMMSKYHNTLID